MTQTGKKSQGGKKVAFPSALRSFLGHLEGTEKAAHTIGSYRSDLATFQEFLNRGLGSRPVELSRLNLRDLNRYHEYLNSLGLKTNTRRRKLLTVRRFLRYLSQRNKIGFDVGNRIPAPYKVEKIPATVDQETLLRAIRKLPLDTSLQARNHALLWTLAETGCLVSEAARLRFENWGETAGQGAFLQIEGKSPRVVPVSRELLDLIRSLRAQAKEKDWLFMGFNKFGPLGGPITPRGIELLVRFYAEPLGFPELTPRTFRHSAVVHWFRSGLSQLEIQKRLGLKTSYAFRVYQPLFQKVAKSKS